MTATDIALFGVCARPLVFGVKQRDFRPEGGEHPFKAPDVGGAGPQVGIQRIDLRLDELVVDPSASA
jgi:hypothetical protein